MTETTTSSYIPPTLGGNSKAALEATNFATSTASDIRNDWNAGSLSIRVVAIVTALVMMITSLISFVTNFVTLHWVAAFFKIYVFATGVLVLLLESTSKNRFSLLAPLESKLFAVMPFVKSVTGRGILYIALGLSLCFLGFLMDLMLGLLLIFVGASYAIWGHRSNNKLAAKQGSDVTENLQEKFAMADGDGQGSLTLEQFRVFVASLGLELNMQESEVAFLTIDVERNGRLSYESVHSWWTRETATATTAC